MSKTKIGRVCLPVGQLEGNREPAFPVGSLVRLRLCPSGEPGCVEGTKYRRVLVRWEDLGGCVGRHRPETLTLVREA
jgi:hypothetical protein